ncbi:MAG: TniB family NTP-binding protein [Betaproteobacteria bacterium]
MIDLKRIVETTLVPHTAFQEASRRLEQCFDYANGSSEPICIAVVGESRTGKSRVLEECFINHPTVRHSEGLEVPILRVKTPSKPTVKGLTETMLRAMGDPKFSSGSESNMTSRLATLVKNALTRTVMIDEFQHFYDKGTHTIMHYVADWLKNFVDESKVALVVAGLPSCFAVINQNEQLVGRFLAPVTMPRFDWQDKDQRDEYIAILGAFQESIGGHFDLPALDGEEMAFRCYCGTGGLIGYLTKFLRQAVWNALDANARTIELADLMHAHDEAVWAKHGLLPMCSPFSKGFSSQPTDDLLARVRLLGTPVEEPPRPRGRRSLFPAKAPCVQAVLSAR